MNALRTEKIYVNTCIEHRRDFCLLQLNPLRDYNLSIKMIVLAKIFVGSQK